MRKHDSLFPCLGFLGMAGLALLGGCSNTYPIYASSDYGPGIKLSSLGPYFAWRPQSEALQTDPSAPYYEVKDFVRGAIECGLEARGFKRAVSESADFWIDYRASSKPQGDPYDLFVQYEMGTIVLHVINPKTNMGIWRGWAETRALESAAPEQRRARICEAIDRILDEFPYRPYCVTESPLEEPGEVVIEGEPVPVTTLPVP